VESDEYDKMHTDLFELKEQYVITDIIGSGGNIIKLNTLAKLRKDRKLSVNVLETLNETLKQHSVDELMEIYKLKADRADVITYAADIYLDVAKSIGAKNFIVPKIGLIDGIIHLLYAKRKSKKKNKANDVVIEESADDDTVEVIIEK
ncbi:MAG TPA: Ppx/GppA family phosphatase, partial [Paludibacter sp.]|nr:Ppx/GppA family phosphatase [Paludibacter sp.]